MLLCFPACSSTAGVASRLLLVPFQNMTRGWPKPAEHPDETQAMLAFTADAFPAGSRPSSVKIRVLHGAYHYFQVDASEFFIHGSGESREEQALNRAGYCPNKELVVLSTQSTMVLKLYI